MIQTNLRCSFGFKATYVQGLKRIWGLQLLSTSGSMTPLGVQMRAQTRDLGTKKQLSVQCVRARIRALLAGLGFRQSPTRAFVHRV